MQSLAPLHADLLTPGEVARGLAAGATVIDVRDPEAFDAGHALGAVNVPGPDAGEVARHLIAVDVPLIALAGDPGEARRAAADLHTAGFRRVVGAVAGRAVGPLLGGAPIGRSGAIALDRLADELATGGVLLVDVRDPLESCTGRMPGSVQLPLSDLRAAAHLLPAVPTVTACSDGQRAAAAASALRRWGHRNVWRAAGGGVADLLARPIGLDLLGAA